MTYQEVKTMGTCDNKEKVLDDPSASRHRIRGMMPT